MEKTNKLSVMTRVYPSTKRLIRIMAAEKDMSAPEFMELLVKAEYDKKSKKI